MDGGEGGSDSPKREAQATLCGVIEEGGGAPRNWGRGCVAAGSSARPRQVRVRDRAELLLGLRRQTDLGSNTRQTKLWGGGEVFCLAAAQRAGCGCHPVREQTGAEREVGGREGGPELCCSSAVRTQPQPRGGD